MNVEELKKLLKENRIHFYSYWGKQKLIELAKINNLLPPKIDEPKKEVEEEKPKYVNYERLKSIRHMPIKVILEDVETKEKKKNKKTYPSIYKAAQFLDQSPQTVRYWSGKKGIWNKKYRIITE